MMATAARRRWTVEEFLAFDDGTDTRYELFDGEIVAMAPPADLHGALVARLIRRIGDALSRPCEIIAEAGIVIPERADSYYQADLAVTCAGLTGVAFVRDPVVIVEVLSPSTARADLERKVPDYRTIPSLEEILVVSSVEPRVEHLCRQADGWKVRDYHRRGTLRSEVLGMTLEIEELYAGLNLEAPAAPRPESPPP